MEPKRLEYELTVCKIDSADGLDLSREFNFIARTEEEISLVCPTDDVPAHTIEREDGWKSFLIEGVLDFSLIGILSKLTAVLAQNNIGVFAVSTYNTDYILVKFEDFKKAEKALINTGYTVR